MKLTLYYPVKPKVINQPFGVNGAYYQAHGINIEGHNGIDFGTYHGQPEYATHDGIAYYEYDANQGEGVVLRTNGTYDSPDGQSQVFYKTIYWHMCDPIKEPQFTSPIYKAVGYKPDQTGVSNIGVPVKAGDLLGYADSTGLSTGDHCHFGLKPQLQNEPNGIWYNTAQNNGFMGAIDPTPFFNGLFAEDAHQVNKIITSATDIAQEAASSPTISDTDKITILQWIINLLKSIKGRFTSN